jgi:hypothetical protein
MSQNPVKQPNNARGNESNRVFNDGPLQASLYGRTLKSTLSEHLNMLFLSGDDPSTQHDGVCERFAHRIPSSSSMGYSNEEPRDTNTDSEEEEEVSLRSDLQGDFVFGENEDREEEPNAVRKNWLCLSKLLDNRTLTKWKKMFSPLPIEHFRISVHRWRLFQRAFTDPTNRQRIARVLTRLRGKALTTFPETVPWMANSAHLDEVLGSHEGGPLKTSMFPSSTVLTHTTRSTILFRSAHHDAIHVLAFMCFGPASTEAMFSEDRLWYMLRPIYTNRNLVNSFQFTSLRRVCTDVVEQTPSDFCMESYMSLLKRLYDNGIDPNSIGLSEQMPFTRASHLLLQHEHLQGEHNRSVIQQYGFLQWACQDENGNTPLHHAVSYFIFEREKKVRDKKCENDSLNSVGESDVTGEKRPKKQCRRSHAMQNEHLGEMPHEENDRSKQPGYKNDTSAMWETIIRWLLSNSKAVLKREYFSGNTPLHLALKPPYSRCPCAYAVQLIVDCVSHKTLSQLLSTRNIKNGGLTPIQFVCTYPSAACKESLEKMVHAAQKFRHDLPKVYERIWSPLRTARNSEYGVPLHLAAAFHYEALRILIEEAGVDPSRVYTLDGKTCLHVAVERKNFDAVDYLLHDRRVDVCQRDNLFESALHKMVCRNVCEKTSKWVSAVGYALQYALTRPSFSVDSKRALANLQHCLYCLWNCPDCEWVSLFVEALDDPVFNVGQPSRKRRSVWDETVKSLRAAIPSWVEKWLRVCIRESRVPYDLGRSFLHYPVHRCASLVIYRLLMHWGADPRVRDYAGRTPLDDFRVSPRVQDEGAKEALITAEEDVHPLKNLDTLSYFTLQRIIEHFNGEGELGSFFQDQSMVCPITQELIRDPVFLRVDGGTYERSAIQEWLAKSRASSPLTNIEIRDPADAQLDQDLLYIQKARAALLRFVKELQCGQESLEKRGTDQEKSGPSKWLVTKDETRKV